MVTLGSAHKGLAFAFDILIRTIGKAKTTSKELSSRRDGLLAKMRDTSTKEDLQITMVNIGGSLRRYRGSDGFVRPVELNDMINEVVNYKHSMLNKNDQSFQIIYNVLARHVYVIKLALVEFNFEQLEKQEEYYLQFKIPFRKKKQSYPSEETLVLSPGEDKIKPENPVVIFSDFINSNQQVVLEIRIFRPRFLKDNRIFTSRFILIKSANKGMRKTFTLTKKNVFDLKLHFNLYHLSKF